MLSLKKQVVAEIVEENNTVYSYFLDQKKIWTKPAGTGTLAYNHNSIVTSPDWKVSRIDFRDLNTFVANASAFPDEGFEFSLTFNFMFDDNVVIIQREKTKENKIQEIIATAYQMVNGKKLWQTRYKGSHSFVLNEANNTYYALFGRHEPEGKMLYLNSLNLQTGGSRLEVIEKNTEVRSIPWLSVINGDMLFISDADFPDGGAIVAFDI